jgi:Bax protein
MKNALKRHSRLNDTLTFIYISGFIVALLAPFTFKKVLTPTLIEPEIVGKPVEKVKEIEKPLHDVDLPDFAKILDIQQKKSQFFDFLRPSITQENQYLLDIRQQLFAWREKILIEEHLSEEEQQQLVALAKTYKVEINASVLSQINELLVRVDIVPSALILVQAANESAWGTSRFARIGLNFFGIWCFRPTCGMVPGGRDTGAKHEVAAFKSVDEAVKRYLYNINTHNAYRLFRAIRSQLRAENQPLYPEVLATGLLPYSQRGADYVLEISEMIRHNRRYLFTDELVASE